MAQPTKYKPEFCDQLVTHMSTGRCFESFADKADVCVRTLFYWLDEHEEFMDAKGRGEAKSLAVWESLGLRAMAGTVKNFNAAVWIFTGKCKFRKFGFRDYEPEESTRKIEDKAEQAAKLIAHLTEMVKDTQCQPVQIYSSPSLVESPPQGLLGASSEPKLTS